MKNLNELRGGTFDGRIQIGNYYASASQFCNFLESILHNSQCRPTSENDLIRIYCECGTVNADCNAKNLRKTLSAENSLMISY